MTLGDWYGLGTVLWDVAFQRALGHDGAILGYSTVAMVFPHDAVTVAVLIPQTQPAAGVPDVTIADLVLKLRDEVTDDVVGAATS